MFLVKPSPGTKYLSTVSYQQVFEIKDMCFVTNEHIMVKFDFGLITIWKANGQLVYQRSEVKEFLDQDPKVVAQSNIINGTSFVALEIKFDITQRNMVVLQF